MRFAEYQKQEIERIQQCYKEQTKDKGVTAENVAAVMQEYCSDLGYEEALSVCSRIQQGIEEFSCLCKDWATLTDADYVKDMLDRMTQDMDQEQRKGFFLQCLDSFEKHQLSPQETVSRAALTEKELEKLLENRMREFSRTTVFEMKTVLEDPCFQSGEETQAHPMEDVPTKEDAFLFAAAEYTAYLDGTLPMEFGECPEFLGICASAQIRMIQYCGERAAEYADEQEETSEIMEGILCTAVGAAFAIGAAVVGLVAAPALEAMITGTVGALLFVIFGMTMYMTFLCGCMSAAFGLIWTVGTCVEKWRENYKAENSAEIQMQCENITQCENQEEEGSLSEYVEVMA